MQQHMTGADAWLQALDESIISIIGHEVRRSLISMIALFYLSVLWHIVQGLGG